MQILQTDTTELWFPHFRKTHEWIDVWTRSRECDRSNKSWLVNGYSDPQRGPKQIPEQCGGHTNTTRLWHFYNTPDSFQWEKKLDWIYQKCIPQVLPLNTDENSGCTHKYPHLCRMTKADISSALLHVFIPSELEMFFEAMLEISKVKINHGAVELMVWGIDNWKLYIKDCRGSLFCQQMRIKT